MRAFSLSNFVSLRAESSPAFIEEVFNLYESGQVFAIVRGDVADDPRLTGATTREVSGPASGWVRRSLRPNLSDDPAQIVFSSGTEGRPKAIVLSHRNLASTTDRLNAAMEVTAEIREYIGVPVTYSFGLGRARAVATAGGASYIPAKFDPSEIRRMLEAGEINAISAVPSLWRILLRARTLLDGVADRVRWIEIGSQFMSADEKRALRRLFPDARIVQHYGLTEASRSTFLDVSRAPDQALGSIGRLDGDVEVEIAEDGAIRLRGEHVAIGRIDGGDGRIVGLTDADGWLSTKDHGEIRDGWLYFLGRMDDQINISGIKVGAERLEQSILERLPELEGRLAVTSVEDEMRGHAALLVLEDGAGDREGEVVDAALAALARHGVTGGDNLRTFRVTELPHTGSGKVQRAACRDLYAAARTESRPRRAARWRERVPGLRRGARPDSVMDVFRSHFPRADLTQDDSLDSLGGDSLSYLGVALDLEAILGDLPPEWQTMSIAALERSDRAMGRMGRIDTPTFLRALAITLIAGGHLGAFEYGGTGALLLFFIAGMNFASLTVPAVLDRGSPAPILVLLARISMLTWASILLIWGLTGYGSIPALMMITNWLAPGYPGGVWFIAVYIQLLLVVAAVLSLSPVRETLRRHRFATATGFAVLMIVVMTASDRVWDTHHLYRRLPHLLGWIFACGIMAQMSESTRDRLASLAVFLAGWTLFSGIDIRFIVFAVPVAIMVPGLPIPRVLAPAVRMVASASLLIYLSHFQFASLVRKLAGEIPIVETLVAIAGGLVAWQLYRPVDDRIRSFFARILERGAERVPSRNPRSI